MDTRSRKHHPWLVALFCLIPVAAVGIVQAAGAPLSGGHHVSGTFHFRTVNLEIVGRIDVAGVPERTFNWDLP